MSRVGKRVSYVEMVLFKSSLMVVRLAVSVDAFPSYSSRSFHAVTLTRCTLVLLGRIDATRQTYETLRPSGMFFFLMKNTVFVPLGIRVLTPCANRPRSFRILVSHRRIHENEGSICGSWVECHRPHLPLRSSSLT